MAIESSSLSNHKNLQSTADRRNSSQGSAFTRRLSDSRTNNVQSNTDNYVYTPHKNLHLIRVTDHNNRKKIVVTSSATAFQAYKGNDVNYRPLSNAHYQRLLNSGQIVTSGNHNNSMNINVSSGKVAIKSAKFDRLSANLNLKGSANTNLEVKADNSNMNVSYQGTSSQDDVIINTRGRVEVNSGDGNDNVSVNNAAVAKIDSGNGLNTISANNIGSVDVKSGKNSDTIKVSGAARTKIDSGAGDDSILATNIDRLNIESGNGADKITASQFNNADIKTGEGNDTVRATFGNNAIIETRNGNDTITAIDLETAPSIKSGDGNDYIRTGRHNDVIDAGNGHDIVYSGGGNDVVHGKEGDDYIDGGSGNDRLLGGNGKDVISGGYGDDNIHGGNQGDVLIAGPGNDQLKGGNGADKAYAQIDDTVQNDVETTVNSNISDKFNIQKDLSRILIYGPPGFEERISDDLVTLRSVPRTAEGLSLIQNATSSNGTKHPVTIVSGDPYRQRDARAEVDFSAINHQTRNPEGAAETLHRNSQLRDSNGDGIGDTQNAGAPAVVFYNPDANYSDGTDRPISSPSILYHELAHAYDIVKGENDDSAYSGPDRPDNLDLFDRESGEYKKLPNSERDAVGLQSVRPNKSTNSLHPKALTENVVHKALGYPKRNSYISQNSNFESWEIRSDPTKKTS